MPVVELMTAALIVAAAAEGSTIGRRLSWPPLVAIGLTSYALYLWHTRSPSISHFP
jgi:peptidoglycan/LPS O-acetylase OafA/YrhL